MPVRTHVWRTLALTAVCGLVALVALPGCGGNGGGGGTDVDAAVRAWTESIEQKDITTYQRLAAANYSYDGAAATAEDGTSPGLGAPAFMTDGAGTTTTEIIPPIEEISPTHVRVRVRVQFVGTMGGWYGGGVAVDDGGLLPPSNSADGAPLPSGAGDAQEQTSTPPNGFATPGFGGTTRPLTSSQSAGAVRSRGVSLRQFGDQVAYTAVVVLDLEQISGAWFIVAQRVESSITLIGQVLSAPIIDQVLVNGSTSATAQPGSDVTLSGTARNVTDQGVGARIGYKYGWLELDGTAFSGTVRAPRVAGAYVAEVTATSWSYGGGWAMATRSVEVTLQGEPDPSYTFTVGEGVELNASAQQTINQYIAGVREATWWGNDDAAASALEAVDPAYSYNGTDAYGALWASGIGSAEDTALAVAATGITQTEGAYTVTLSALQESTWTYAGYGGGDVRPLAADEDAETVDGSDVAVGAPGGCIGYSPYWYGNRHSRLLFELDRQTWKITAIRVALAWGGDDAAPAPTANLTVNGGETAQVAPGADVTVAGDLGDAATEGASVSLGWQWQWVEAVGQGFSVTIPAPEQPGRYVVTAYLWSNAYGEEVTVSREVVVAGAT